MRILENIALDFKDVLILPQRTSSISRSQIILENEYKKNNGTSFKAIGIIAANMDSTGTFEMAKALSKHNCMTALHKHYSVDALVEFYTKNDKTITDSVFYTLGIGDNDLEKLSEFLKRITAIWGNLDRIDKVCVDVANGYQNAFVEKVKIIREMIPNAFLMAGNVVTPNMVEELILNANVEMVKVGIGSGACCKTRLLTGCGYPQLQAAIDCSFAAHGLKKYICSDGGCVIPGDICKAFGGGSDAIMTSGMLGGTDECSGEIIEKDGKNFKKMYGMSSKTAQEKYNNGLAKYKASEGRTALIPCRGSVAPIIEEILGGLRSACTYVGAKKLKDFSKCCTFVRTTIQENKVFEKFDTGEN